MGNKDFGDINLGTRRIVCECKAVKTFNLATWMDELTTETANTGPFADIGFLWVKRPRKASPLDGYIIVPPRMWLPIMRGYCR
jgi:hypothetical protein